MAVIKLTLEQHAALVAGRKRPLMARIPVWGVIVCATILAALTRQFLFLIVATVVATLVLLLLRWPATLKAKQSRHDPFLLGPYSVELGEHGYRVEARDNVLELSLGTLDQVEDYRTHYVLRHRAGARTVLPKAVLTPEETARVEAYRQVRPQRSPWNP